MIPAQRLALPYNLLSALQINTSKCSTILYKLMHQIKTVNEKLYLFWLAVFTTNSCDNYMTCLCPVTSNNGGFHFLCNRSDSKLLVKHSRLTNDRKEIKYCTELNKFTFSSLIFMSFIFSGNLSTATLFPLGSLNPKVGATPTEAIWIEYEKKLVFSWFCFSCRSKVDAVPIEK